MYFPKTRRIVNLLALSVLGKPILTTQEDVNSAVDLELDSPLRIYAGTPADARLYIRASEIASSDGALKTVGPVGITVPSSINSWIDLQAQNTSGAGVSITFPASTVGFFRRLALSIGSDSLIVATFSNEVAALPSLPNAGAIFPSNAIPIGWVDLECTDVLGRFKSVSSGGNTVVNDDIHRIRAGGGGGGSTAGVSREFPIPDAVDTVTVLFPAPLASNNYVVQIQIVNVLDANPQFLFPIVTQKTNLGFTAVWNAPVDSANYKLAYQIPAIQLQIGEFALANAVDSATVLLPIPLDNTNYSVIAELIDLTDLSPITQTVVITNKTNNDFTAKWNAPVDSGNYRLAYKVAYFS